MGRMIERAIVTARLLDVYLSQLVSRDHVMAFHRWVGVLRSAGAFQESQKIFQVSLDPTDAVEFLLQAKEFPRSVLRCVIQIESLLSALRTPETAKAAWREIGLLRAQVEYADIRATIAGDLGAFLADIVDRLESFSVNLATELFDVAPATDSVQLIREQDAGP
jgi:uncharacterized alpha-E superfamily protein